MSIENARRTSLELMRVTDALGTAEQNGTITRAYTVARDALHQNLALADVTAQKRAAKETLFHLRDAVRAAAREAFEEAWKLGVAQAERDAAEFGFEVELPTARERDALLNRATDVIDADTRKQTDALWLLILLGFAANARLIFGNLYLNPAPVLKNAKFWAAAFVTQTYDNLTVKRMVNLPFRAGRMAVLGSNVNHTQTCLNASGQVVGLEEDFVLTGTPRYADRMRNPPFHDYCYTTVAIVRFEG